MIQNQFEHGGNLYQIKREGGGSPPLDFSANINPLGLPDSVRQAVTANVETLVHYPDAEGYALKHALAQAYALSPEKLILGNGAVELLYILCHQLRPRNALIPAPAFSEYERACRAANTRVAYHFLLPEDGFALDVSALAKKTTGYDLLFIGNPNNPTGTLLRREEIAEIAEKARQSNTLVVVDESFMDFISENERYSANPLLDQYDNLFILHSLTKFYAIPGLRLGFAAANRDLAARLHLGKDPWNVNSLAQAAGLAALNDKAYAESSRSFIAAERQRFYARLKQFSRLKVYPPTVNFLLADLEKTALTAATFKSLCLKESILVRDCSNYPGLSGSYVRFAIKSTAENETLYRVLEKVIGGEQ